MLEFYIANMLALDKMPSELQSMTSLIGPQLTGHDILYRKALKPSLKDTSIEVFLYPHKFYYGALVILNLHPGSLSLFFILFWNFHFQLPLLLGYLFVMCIFTWDLERINCVILALTSLNPIKAYEYYFNFWHKN